MKKIINSERMLDPQESIFWEKKFSIEFKNIPAGSISPFHWHDYYEFEILLEGSARQTINTSIYEMPQYSAFLLESSCHSIEFKTDATILNICLAFDFFPESISEHLSTLSFAKCTFSKDNISYILKQIDKISSPDYNKLFYNEMAQSILTEIIILFINNSELSDKKPNKHYLAQKAVNYIKENIYKELTIYQVANKLSVTPKHLGKIFKNTLHTSFNDYVNILRLKYACTLLLSSNLSTKEIAYKAGYSSEQYFYYVFKKYIKKTPSEYKKLVK